MIIIGTHLLQLEQFSRLHQVLQLQGTLRHVMGLAPLFDTGDIVLDLHGCMLGTDIRLLVNRGSGMKKKKVPRFQEEKFLLISKSLKLVTPISLSNSVTTCCTTDSSM